ncbi:MAG: phosphate/phosphite/phosphonate ABC transporter substrate-binding protein, partial [Betaproteobacteria bacterium]|nr:phosphate/phosphite/phosphonate ABC transporter substrate-binding protein [Betaproteobacteria bacterium]
MQSKLSACLLFCALAIGLVVRPAEAATYVLGVVPQFPATEVYRTWTPVLEAIKAKTGIELTLRVYETIPVFEKSFLAGEPDLVYYNPYHAVMGKRARNYLPLVRSGDKPLSGILVVTVDGPIKSLKDLQDKAIAFPAPNAFGASLYMRALLAEKHGLRITPVYSRTHGNAYRSVALGETAAAGGIAITLAGESAELRDQ